MPLFDQVSQMVAQARPQMHVGGGQRVIPNQGYVRERKDQGYGQMGQNFGEGFGKALAREFDPDEQRKQAEMTRKLLVSMPKDLRKNTIANPDVQARLKKYYKYAPEMFADASLTQGDQALKGMLDVVDEEFSARERQGLEKRGAQAEVQAAEKKPGLMDAQTQETQAAAGLKKQQFDLNAELHNVTVNLQRGEYDIAVQKLENLKAQTAGVKQQTEEAEATQGSRSALLRAQAAKATYEASPGMQDLSRREKESEISYRSALISQAERKAKEDARMSDADRQTVIYAAQQNKAIETDKMMMGQPRKQAVAQLNVASSVIQSTPVEQIVGKDGVKIQLPGIITKPHLMTWVNDSLLNSYEALSQMNLDRLNESQAQEVYRMSQGALNVFADSYGHVINPDVQRLLPQEVLGQYMRPDMELKMLYMRYAGEKAKAKLEGKKVTTEREVWYKQQESRLIQQLPDPGGALSRITVKEPGPLEKFIGPAGMGQLEQQPGLGLGDETYTPVQ